MKKQFTQIDGLPLELDASEIVEITKDSREGIESFDSILTTSGRIYQVVEQPAPRRRAKPEPTEEVPEEEAPVSNEDDE